MRLPVRWLLIQHRLKYRDFHSSHSFSILATSYEWRHQIIYQHLNELYLSNWFPLLNHSSFPITSELLSHGTTELKKKHQKRKEIWKCTNHRETATNAPSCFISEHVIFSTSPETPHHAPEMPRILFTAGVHKQWLFLLPSVSLLSITHCKDLLCWWQENLENTVQRT